MGMFDYIRCDVPLPDGDDAPKPPTRWFQTKDLVCAMDKYIITEDGRLLHYGYRTEDRSDPNAEDFIGRIAGMCTRVYDEQLDEYVPHHGDVYLTGGHDGEFYIYAVRFTEGRVTKTWLHLWEHDQ